MNLLFVNDHKFYTSDDGKVYSGSSFPAYVWERYLGVFDKITVASRGAKWSSDIKGLVESTNTKVNFDLLYEVHGGLDYFKKTKAIKTKLKTLLADCDAVVIRFPSSIGMWCADLCKEMDIPYATEVVGCAWDATWNYGSLPTRAIAPYIFLKMKAAVKRSIASIYVTEFFLQKRYPNLGKPAAHASNVEIDDFTDDILVDHQSFLNRGLTEINIGIVGNLTVKYKGFDTAMKALAIAKTSGITFKFHLVGGGSDTYVKELVKANGLENEVNVVGRLQSGSEVFSFLDKLDLYLHPSKQEGLPRAVIEAMSRACPVLASSIAGIPELLGSSYLHKPGDFKTLATQLEDIMQNKAERNNMSRANFYKAKEYTNDILKQRRDEFWQEVGRQFSKLK